MAMEDEADLLPDPGENMIGLSVDDDFMTIPIAANFDMFLDFQMTEFRIFRDFCRYYYLFFMLISFTKDLSVETETNLKFWRCPFSMHMHLFYGALFTQFEQGIKINLCKTHQNVNILQYLIVYFFRKVGNNFGHNRFECLAYCWCIVFVFM